MRLWLLKARTDLPTAREANPWVPWYDKADGFVVRAESDELARKLAQEQGGDEVGASYNHPRIPAWTDSKFSTCEPLEQDGAEGVVLCDFSAA